MPLEPLKPYSYRELSDLHKQWSAEDPDVFGSMSLGDFSKQLNSATGQRVADAGLGDSFIKAASANIDRGIEATGLPEVTGSVGRAIGDVFGLPDAGERVGRSFPRGVVNFAPVIAAEALSGGAATPLVAGLLGTGALSAADTYTETGSGSAALISGLGAAAVPAAFKVGGQLALKATGAPIFDEVMGGVGKALLQGQALPKVGERFGTSLTQKAAEFVGGNLATVIEGEVAGEASSVAQGEGLYNPLTAEHVFETALNVGPWAALGIPALRRSTAAEFVTNFMKTGEAAQKADSAAAGRRVAAGVATDAERQLTAGIELSTEYEGADLVKDFTRFDKKNASYTPTEPVENTITVGDPPRPPAADLYYTPDGQIVTILGEETTPRGKKLTEVKPAEPGASSFMTDGATLKPYKPTDERGFSLVGDGELTKPTRPAKVEKPIMGIEPEAWEQKKQQLLLEWKQPETPVPTTGEPSLRAPDTASPIEAVSEQPLPTEVAASLPAKDVSIPEKATTAQVREHLTDTITIRKTLADQFEIAFPELSDAQIDHSIKEFSRMNPNHPDPMSGFAESYRAETIRKAQQEDLLRHAGKSIGVEERTMNEAMERLSRAPKGEMDPKTGKIIPGDADTVARVAGEYSSEQTLGVQEAIYRAYGSFVKDKEAKGVSTWSQSELASFLGRTGQRAKMKGEAELSGSQISMDAQDATTGRTEHEKLGATEQLDPGLSQATSEFGRIASTDAKELERSLPSGKDELHSDDSVAGHDVAAFSDDHKLMGVLSKLTWLVKERPELWGKIWERNAKLGETRTRLYVNLVFDKLQQRGKGVTPSELNQQFALYDAVHGTKLAYYDKNKLASAVPKAVYTKLLQTFKYIDSLPDFGVEGAKGDRNFLASVDLTSNPSGTPMASKITTRDFYQRMFRERMGYSKPLADAMSEHMVRIVSAFGDVMDKTRITGLETNAAELGAYLKNFGNPLWKGIVGIAEKNYGSTSKNLVMHQLVLAHEMTHGIENQYQLMRDNPGTVTMSKEMFDSFKRMDDISEQLTPDQRSTMMGEVRDMLLNSKFKSKELDMILSESAKTPSEFRATLGSLITMNHVGEGGKTSRAARELMLAAPKEFADYMKGMVRYVADMGRALWSSIRGYELLGLELPFNKKTRETLSSVAQEYYNLFSQTLDSSKKIDAAVAKLAQYEQLSPSMYSTLVQANRLEPIRTSAFEGAPDYAVQMMKEVKEDLGIDGVKPKSPTFIQRNLEQFTQLAERYTPLRNISNIAFFAQHTSEQNLAKLHSVLGSEVDANGKAYVDKKMTRTMKVAQSLPAREAFSEIARLQQDRKGLIDRNDPMVKKALEKFSPEMQENIWTRFELVNSQNVMVANERVTGMKDINGLIVAKLIQELEPTRPAKVTEQLGHTLIDGLSKNDIMSVSQATSQLQPETMQKVQALALSLHEGWDRLRTQTAEKPWYFNERRYGQFAVTYVNKEGKTGRASADTQAQIDAIVAKETKAGSKILQHFTPEDMRKPLSQYSDSYRQAVIDAQDKSLAILRDVLKNDPEMLARIEPLLDIEADASSEMMANDVRKLNPFRKHAPGREYVDYLDASMISNSATVRGLTRRWLRAKAALHTLDPELAKEPALQRLAQQHVDNILTPDAPLGQALAKANFYYYIVGNLGNMMQEPFQQVSTILPALQREGAGFFKSQGLLLNANKEIASYWKSGKTGDAVHDQVLTRFASERENPHGFLSDFDSEGLAAINAVRFSENKTLLDKATVLAQPLAHVVEFAKKAYLKVPEHNARVTMLAAFDNARAKGMSFDAAYQDAVRVYRYSNFAGGKANRAVGVYSGRDPFTKSAAQTVMSLQTYQTGYISMMSRLISEGFGKDSELSPGARSHAKKAAVTMLGVQFALAGALGMPFAGQGVAMLQQLFPNLELEKNIRLGLDTLVGSDGELGGFATNSITHGVLGEIGGVDLSTRFGLGNMFGMSSFGYDPANVLGPTGGLIRNMIMGIKDASTGELSKAVQDIVPPQLKRVVNAYREGNEFRDNAGNLLFEGTSTEKTFRLLGYTPSRERDVREQQRIMTRSEQVAQAEITKFYGGLADRVETGDYAGVRDALLQKQRDDPSFDARAGLRRVSAIAEQRLNPTDMRTQGTARTADDRQRLLNTYNAQGGTTEVQRLQQRANIEKTVGITNAGHISKTELAIAQMTDHLTSLYPGLNKDQVKMLARKEMSRRVSQETRDEWLQQ